jgi:hypothetical protein
MRKRAPEMDHGEMRGEEPLLRYCMESYIYRTLMREQRN